MLTIKASVIFVFYATTSAKTPCFSIDPMSKPPEDSIDITSEYADEVEKIKEKLHQLR